MREYSAEAKYVIGESETIITSLQDLVKKRPKLVLFTRPKNFEWVNVTAQEFWDEASAVAKGLIANGVQSGDRVALLSETRYEWNLVNIGAWMAGAVVVPIYGSSSTDQIRWIVENSGAVFGVTETRSHTTRMDPLVIGSTDLAEDTESRLTRVLEINSGGVDTLMFEGRDIPDEEVEKRFTATKADDMASIIYTSGTTGRPKGCVLLHSNWLAEARAILTNQIGLVARPGNRLLTFLPLAHVLAHAVSLACMIAGATQSHWSDFKTITLEFQRSRPHLILGVPRVFEKVRDGAYANAKEKGPVFQALFERAEATAIEYSKALDTASGPSKALSLRQKLYDKLLFAKIREAMGEAVQYTISGGSALSSDVAHFFRGLGVTVYEGYGLTETTAAITVNNPGDQVVGTVGRPVGGCSVRIADDGEIQVAGPVVFKEYWKNEEATAATFDGEWFKTGDIGELDETGHLKITGRKKDLLVTAGGKNVAPGPMEDRMRAHPLVSQAVVIGDGRPFISVLVTLDEEAMAKWKVEHAVPENTSIRELAASSPVLRAEIQDAVNSANELVSHAEAIKKFHILPEDFTEETGELTPTMKVKRNVVTDKYARQIEDLYHR